MSEAILQRREDPSGLSGIGPVAEIFEASDGAVAIRWKGARASWGLWADIRDLEAIHGHDGKSVVEYLEPSRLARAYQRVVPFLLEQSTYRPVTVKPHPDYPDRLKITFLTSGAWRYWVALLDGSTYAATHEEVAGEMQHTWIDPSGDIFLQHFTPLTQEDQK